MSDRLDVALVKQGFCETRSKAQQLIKSGFVLVDGNVETKAGIKIDANKIELIGELKYVARSGQKLETALVNFEIDVNGAICLDIGASTGGFTQCLLNNGAAYVYALDVGTDQLHKTLRDDIRVCNMPGINARAITKSQFDKAITVITMDVSFISQRLLYSAVADVLCVGGTFISLIKPQFELGREHIKKGGIVQQSEVLYKKLFNDITASAAEYGLKLINTMDSPILGGDGNREFLAYFIKKAERKFYENSQDN